MRFLTIGHSNHSIEAFLNLLDRTETTAIADVRTTPFSRWNPHFTQKALKTHLADHGLAYAFLGEELGGRPATDDLYTEDGTADYEAMAKTDLFQKGIARIVKGAQTHCICLMCSEKHPTDCHRCLLVGRYLAENGHEVGHVHADATIEDHADLEKRVLKLAKQSADLFDDDSALKAAYRTVSLKAAFKKPSAAQSPGSPSHR